MPSNTSMAFNTINRIVVARNNLLFYPAGHEIINRSVKEAYDSLCVLLGAKTELRILIREGFLAVGDETLDLENSANKEFHKLVNQFDLVLIVFSKGLPQEEFFKFLSLFNKAGDKVLPETVRKNLKRLLPHITLEFVDYNRINPLASPTTTTAEKEERSQRSLHPGTIAGDPLNQMDPVYRISADGIEPVSFSQRIAPEEDWQFWVDDYKKELTQLRSWKPQTDPVPTSGSGADVRGGHQSQRNRSDNGIPVQPILDGREKTVGALDGPPHQNLQSIVEQYEQKLGLHHPPLSGREPGEVEIQKKVRLARTILMELNPALQDQLRSFNFETIFNHLTPLELDSLLDDSDTKTALEKLKHINEGNLELSPALAGLIKKMLAVSDHQTLDGFKKETLGDDREGLSRLDDLIKREAHEKYVISEYDRLLKSLSGEVSPEINSQRSFSVEEHQHIFEDIYADTSLTLALLSALQQESTQEEYVAYMESLVQTFENLLAHGELPLSRELLHHLHGHSRAVPGSFRSSWAQKSLDALKTRGTIEKIVDLLDGPGKRPYADLFSLAESLGPEIVPATVDLYSQTKTPYALKFLTDLLLRFKPRTEVEIDRRLSQDKGLFPGHLFRLIKHLGLEAGLSETLKQLLTHEDPKVEDEALEALLRIKDLNAHKILFWLIASEQKESYEKGLAIAVRLKVVETAPYLIKAVKGGLFLMRDHSKKMAMVQALGRMGATEAIPLLEAVARKRWAISRKKLVQLKEALFQSLDGFRPDQIESLISIGTRLSNPRIAAALRNRRDQGKGSH